MEIKVDSGDLIIIEDKDDGLVYTYIVSLENDEVGRDQIIATNITDPLNKVKIKFFQNATKANHQ